MHLFQYFDTALPKDLLTIHAGMFPYIADCLNREHSWLLLSILNVGFQDAISLDDLYAPESESLLKTVLKFV